MPGLRYVPYVIGKYHNVFNTFSSNVCNIPLSNYNFAIFVNGKFQNLFTHWSSDSFLDCIFLHYNYFFVIYYLGEYFQFLVTRSGYVETNRGPKKQAHLKFFHWNLNGSAAHNFAKVPLIKVLIKRFHFDIVYLKHFWALSVP